MFRIDSSNHRKSESQPRITLVSFSDTSYCAERMDVRVWWVTSVCFFLGALVDYCFTGHFSVLSDVLLGLASLVPPLGTGILKFRFRWTWSISFGLFWIAQTILLFRTGGIASPIFGGHTLLLLLIIGGIYVRRPLKMILSAGAFHLVGWTLVSYAFKLTSPSQLTLEQVITQNLLICVATVCTVFAIARNIEYLANQCEDQKKSLTEVQNHLCHSERMAEIGKLVATTAHEFAQPLQVIYSASSLIEKLANDPSRASEIRRHSEKIHVAAERLRKILGQLRNFSRKESLTPETFDLVEAIRSVQTLSQYDLRWYGVECRFQHDSQPLWSKGDSTRVQQVVFNLINNARDACHDTHNPVIQVDAQEFGDWVRINIWNNGPGIPVEVQSKLFEPYFTTKAPGQGTGLGLTICEQIIRLHGGRILFSSRDGDTRFVIDLPRVSQPEILASRELTAS